MKNWIAQFKAWQNERRLRRNMQLFMTLYKDPRSGMDQTVLSAANKVAQSMVMRWMDGRRIQHCTFCPETGTLRTHPMGYVCQSHFEVVTRKPTQKEEATHATK